MGVPDVPIFITSVKTGEEGGLRSERALFHFASHAAVGYWKVELQWRLPFGLLPCMCADGSF